MSSVIVLQHFVHITDSADIEEVFDLSKRKFKTTKLKKAKAAKMILEIALLLGTVLFLYFVRDNYFPKVKLPPGKILSSHIWKFVVNHLCELPVIYASF